MNIMNVLLIFVKNPVAGKVKTRLAATLGDQKALDIYIELLKITKDVTLLVQAERHVWYSSKIDKDDIWDPDQFSKYLQMGDSLGERMLRAFENAFNDGAKKVIIIGSDCPGITTEHIEKAYRLLNDSNVVIGPSADGGYFLLGMNRYLPELFSGIDWSTSKVLEQTKKILDQVGMSYAELEQLNDIDTAEDLKNDIILSARL